jgi:hypothetical protein
MSIFGFPSKPKTRPSRAELLKVVWQYFRHCQCECDEHTHTIRDEANGYVLTITHTPLRRKVRS